MRFRHSLLLALVGLFCLTQTFVSAQAPKGKTVRRAAPPKFDSSATANIFFADAFKDGLSGERPANLGKAPAKIAGSTGTPSTTPSVGGTPASTSSGGIYAWSKLISPTAIEDEVKALKLDVDKDVNTPTDFAGKGYKSARRHFTVLAIMFGIAGEYDGDVRWKKNAPSARDLLARSAGNAKVGTEQVYKEAKLRKGELQDLVGGGGFAGKEAEAKADWKTVCDRSPVMQRLEMAHQGKLQPFTANKGDFSSNKEKVSHEAQIIAALSEVLEKDGMEDADNNDYKVFSTQMKKSALEIVEATKLDNYDAVRKAVGDIGQACSKCHEGFRG